MTVHVAEGVWAAGVLVQSGPPLGTVWIPLDSGLTVLYGRNGAGKSRLLDAVGRALRGVALQDGHVSLHVEFGGPFEFFDEQLLVELADLAGIDVPSPSDIWAERENGDETRPLVNTVCGALSELLVERAHGFGFGDGICHTPRVALEAVGTDAVWGVELDDLDVPSVVRYRLMPPR